VKIAFIFPGQGSQAVGMGMDMAEHFKSARKVFDQANEILGFSLSDMIKNGPEEELKQTINTQPAVVATSIALLEVLREIGMTCDMTAGHSVGEFAALYCAGSLDLESCLKLTRARGQYMNEAGQKYPGSLTAIIGLDLPVVEEICNKASEKGIAVIANLNCPGQIVISGAVEAMKEAGRIAVEMGARKVVPLAVSAAFHSPLMAEAAEKFAKKLDTIKFSDARIPVVSNVSAEPVTDGGQIRELMKVQISSKVLWEKSIIRMVAEGIDSFIEIGHGKVLSGMLRRIDRRIPVSNLGDMKTYESLCRKFELQAVGI